jgi:hypothetical protein
MPATTLDLVLAAFETAISAMPARLLANRTSHAWKRYLNDQPVRSDARWYRFEWEPVSTTPKDFMGPAQSQTNGILSIVVDYGGVPWPTVEIFAEDDHYQIRDVLNRLKSTVPGLRWIDTIQGKPWDYDTRVPVDKNQARIVHRYTVRYMKGRA